MTEPDVASSDPTNLETTAVRDGDDWVLNGRKWCITGAEGAAFAIVVAKTGTDEAAGHRNYSLILVPTDTPGWSIVRHPEWMGSHSPGGHPEVALEDVPRARTRTCSAARARASRSPSSGSPAGGSRTRCAGSARRSARST